MKVVCLGWGSLIKRPGELRLAGEWQQGGPALPVEFARTSRNGRLTLVLTPGVPLVPTFWVELNYATAESAKVALAEREDCKLLAIGLWPGPAPRHAVGADLIAAWAQEKGLDAVVWTALRPKFQGQSVAPESAEAAVAYLQGLGPEATAAAREYVATAPACVRTPFRAAFEEQLGWRQSK
jgi:hypothetical protein